MAKLYHFAGRWELPGQQTKSASRVDIPNDPAGLCAWLNARRVPICLPLNEPSWHGSSLALEQTERLPAPPVKAAPAPSYVHGSVAIDDAWDALPLARKLHFAALAMEEARARII